MLSRRLQAPLQAFFSIVIDAQTSFELFISNGQEI